MERGVDMEEEMKLHSFIVSVDYEISCYTEEEAESMYSSGCPVVVHIEDLGPIE